MTSRSPRAAKKAANKAEPREGAEAALAKKTAKAAPEPPAPEPSDDLEIRLGGRIVFLQPVLRSSYTAQFNNGHFTLYAATADAVELDEVPQEVSQAADELDDSQDEPETNPDVLLQV